MKSVSVTDTTVKEKIGGRCAPTELGGRIKALRESLSLDQKGLAQLIGAKQNTISDWEKGEYRPSPMALIALGNVAGKQRDWWFEQAGPEFAERLRRRPYEQLGYMDAEHYYHDLTSTDYATSAYQKEVEDVEYADRGQVSPRGVFDPDLLEFAMERADAELQAEGRTLRRPEYRRLVALICDFCHRSGTRDPVKVKALFETARSAIHILEPGTGSDRAGEVENSQEDRRHHGHFGTGTK